MIDGMSMVGRRSRSVGGLVGGRLAVGIAFGRRKRRSRSEVGNSSVGRWLFAVAASGRGKRSVDGRGLRSEQWSIGIGSAVAMAVGG